MMVENIKEKEEIHRTNEFQFKRHNYIHVISLVAEFRANFSLFFFGVGGYLLFQGATIRRDEHTGAVIVARIMRGGAADRSGMIAVHISTFCKVP